MQETARTLVIDPGHGGMDGGCVSASGLRESEINLAISMKLCSVCRLFGIDPVLTRSSEQLNYPDEAATTREKKVWDQTSRAALINACENAVLVSIHQNQYPDPRPSGIQVFYGKSDDSMKLGTLAHENLQKIFCPDSRRVAAPISEKIFLLKNVNCPAILVECGFLSNPQEAEKLGNDHYQTAVATVLAASYFQYIS